MNREDINNQKRAIKNSALERNLELIGIYEDKGESGDISFKDREGFQNALKRLTSENFGIVDPRNQVGLISYAVDRLGRNSLDSAICLNHLFNDLKINVYFIRAPDYQLSSDHVIDPISRIVLSNMIQLMAELERSFIIQRTQDRINQIKEEIKITGKHITRKNASKGERIITHLGRDEVPIDWKKVKEYREKGISWSSIARLIGITYKTLVQRRNKIYENTNEEWLKSIPKN